MISQHNASDLYTWKTFRTTRTLVVISDKNISALFLSILNHNFSKHLHLIMIETNNTANTAEPLILFANISCYKLIDLYSFTVHDYMSNTTGVFYQTGTAQHPGAVLFLVLVLCVVCVWFFLYFSFSFGLRPVSCIPNVGHVFGLSILDFPLGFLYRFVIYILGC